MGLGSGFRVYMGLGLRGLVLKGGGGGGGGG